MQNKKTEIFFVAFVALLLGFIIGFVTVPEKEKKILTSDKLDQCVQAGGEYNLHYNDFTEKYQDWCETTAKTLFKNVYEVK